MLEAGFIKDDNCLIKIFTTSITAQKAVNIAAEIKVAFVNAQILGASTCGVIFNGKQYDNDTLIVAEKYEHSKTYVNIFTFKDKSAKDLAYEINEKFTNKSIKLVHFFVQRHYYDANFFIEEFNKICGDIKLTGGRVGDINDMQNDGFLFNEKGVFADAIFTAALGGQRLCTHTDANIAHDPISGVHTANKTQGEYILEIENTPAVQWCEEQFGLQDLKEYKGWEITAQNDDLIRFPIVLQDHGGASRFLKYDAGENKIASYLLNLPSEFNFKIGYSSPMQCVREALRICNAIRDIPVENAFCYTCLFRKMYFKNCAEWELTPFKEIGICGAFMLGEFGNINGKNEYLNGSSSFAFVAEQQKFININFDVFNELYNIKDDNTKLQNFAWQKQNRAMSEENKVLLESLLEQQKLSKENLYKDSSTGLYNTIKFSQDNEMFHFDKICLIKVENSKLLFAKYGQKKYGEFMRKAAEHLKNYILQLEQQDNIFIYSFNDDTQFITANSAVGQFTFSKMFKDLTENHKIMKLDDSEVLLINSFHALYSSDKLLEKALAKSQNDQETDFDYATASFEATNSQSNKEINALQKLTQAIENDGIIPYFQGVYDNSEKKINKYEALMRLRDLDGNIYSPDFFMNIAKKYSLYNKISRMMLAKVFEMFADKKEIVSINLSALDINSDFTCNFIYENIMRMKNANNFIFEILEDESFKDMQPLKDFIKNVRKYGVKIAIDDFGSGYSSFVEIIKIQPDFIKVDGSIVREIYSNEVNRKVLENIVFLGKQINAPLVAEYVENKQIQANILELNIRYSQGYYFAKPESYDDIFDK